MEYNFRGIYSSSGSYIVKDVVSLTVDNVTNYYFCLQSNSSANAQSPSPNGDTQYWGLVNALSNFPNSIDTFITRNPIQYNDKPYLQRYQELSLKSVLTNAEQNELAQLTLSLRDKLILPEDWNKLQQSISNLQMFFKVNIEGYIATKQNELETFVQEKTGEISTISSNAISIIENTKSAAINSIDHKKDSIIQYLEDTNVGALRNDIGDMAELETINTNSLVEALNSHLRDQTNSHRVTTEQVNQIGEKFIVDSPAVYPIGLSVFPLTPDNINPWLESVELSIENSYGLVETTKTHVDGFYRTVQRFTIIGSNEFNTYGTYVREGYGLNNWHLWKKDLSSKDLIDDITSTSTIRPPTANAVKTALAMAKQYTDEELLSKVNNSEKGVPNGVATLDGSGDVPSNQLKHVHQQIQFLSYDLYNIYQEQYYTGNSPVSPSIGAAKSLVFDVISNTDTYNSAESNVTFINQGSGITCGTTTPVAITPTDMYESSFSYGGNYFSKGAGVSGTLSGLLNGSSSYGWIDSGSVPSGNRNTYSPFRIDMGTPRLITGFQIQGGGDTSGAGLALLDNALSAHLGFASTPYNSPNTFSVANFTLPIMLDFARSRYFYGYLSSGTRDRSFHYSYITRFSMLTANFITSTYKSKAFNLGFTPTRATAYVSQKLEGTSSITPRLNCGGTLVSGVASASRPDPNFSGYTEVQYEFNLSGITAKPTEFQINLTPNGINVPFVKRYGIYFY